VAEDDHGAAANAAFIKSYNPTYAAINPGITKSTPTKTSGSTTVSSLKKTATLPSSSTQKVTVASSQPTAKTSALANVTNPRPAISYTQPVVNSGYNFPQMAGGNPVNAYQGYENLADEYAKEERMNKNEVIPPSKEFLAPELNKEYEQALKERIELEKLRAKPINESDIRKQTMDLFKNQIDAVNQVYSQMYNEAKMEGQGRLGTERAISARSGLLGSDFGVARKEGVVAANTANEQGIQAQKAAAVGQIMAQGNQLASQEIAAKKAAQQEGLDSYLSFLGQKAERQQANISSLATSMIEQGVSPDTLSSGQLSKLAKDYGTSENNIINAFQSLKTQQEAQQAQEQAANMPKGFSLGKNESRYEYNPSTGQMELIAQGYSEPEYIAGQYNPEAESWAQLIASGQAKLSDVPSEMRSQAASMLNGLPRQQSKTSMSVLSLVDQLLARDTGAISGIPSLKAFIPGTEVQLTKNLYDQLKGILSLENRTLLEGSGAISDFEARTLEKAASSLGRNLSDADFISELTKLKTDLAGGGTTGGGQDLEGIYNSSTPDIKSQIESWANQGLNDDEILQKIGGFSRVGGDTNQATIARTVTSKYPAGTVGGQCGDFVRKVASNMGLTYPRLGDSLKSKISVVQKYGTSPSNAGIGSVIVTRENPTYGHVAYIIGRNQNGWIVSESNYKQSNKISHGRVIPYNSSAVVGVINPTRKA
jgi:hypothetical protein